MATQPPLWEKPLWFQWLLLVTLLFSSYAVVGIIATIIPSSDLRSLAVLLTLGTILLPALVYAGIVYPHPHHLQEAGFTPPIHAAYYLIAIFIMLFAIPLVQALAVWNEGLHLPSFMKGLDTWIRDTEKSQDGTITNLLAMPSYSSLLLNMVVMALFPAIAEEALFRGVFQKLLYRKTHNIHKAVFWGALIFSALHFQFLGFFPRLLLGMVLGYLFAYSESLWPSIIAHFIYDGSQVLLSYFQQHQPAGHASPIFRDDFSIPVMYVLISTVLVMAGIYWMRKLNPRKWH
jgi:membrane protease YdiL (CAAX protease family)